MARSLTWNSQFNNNYITYYFSQKLYFRSRRQCRLGLPRIHHQEYVETSHSTCWRTFNFRHIQPLDSQYHNIKSLKITFFFSQIFCAWLLYLYNALYFRGAGVALKGNCGNPISVTMWVEFTLVIVTITNWIVNLFNFECVCYITI